MIHHSIRFCVSIMLTLAEKIEIFELSATRSVRDTAKVFNNRYPLKPDKLSYGTVRKIRENFKNRGDLHRKKRTTSAQTKIDAANKIAKVCLHFRENPHESVRRGAATLDSSPSTVWKILRKEVKFHPYKMSVHQRLHDGDAERRKAFCIQMLDRINADPDFHKNVFWTDEKPFRVHDSFNRQNMR